MFADAERWRLAKGALLFLLPVVLALVAYYPVTRVYFIADDFANMVMIENRGVVHFLVSPFGGHMLFLRNLEIYLAYRMFGPQHPEGYYYVALAMHLLNVALLFRVLKMVVGSDEIAALGAALWGTSPVLAGAVGWFAVHGQVLSGTFLLIVLGQAMAHQTNGTPVSKRSACLWCALLLLGATCFGTAMAVAIAFPVAFFILFERRLRALPVLLIVAALPAVTLLLYFGWHWGYAMYDKVPDDETALRSIAISAVLPPLEMFGYLHAIGATSLLRGYLVSAGYPTVNWWLTAFAALLVSSALAFGGTAARRRALSVLTLMLAIYGMIALGRANLYSMFGLSMSEAARQLRYHYASTIPLVLLLCMPIGALLRSEWIAHVGSVRFRQALPASVLAGWLALSGFFYATSTFGINTNPDCRRYVGSAIRDIERQIDAAAPGSEVRIPNQVLPNYCMGFMGYDGIPGWAALFILFHPTDTVRGRQVSFVEQTDYAGMFDHPKNARLAPLLRSP